ncbi:zf-TFIIB domain-containing protein [Tautonia sp. JC769]|uniref:TFIIB-type zinc ribbon-containing protein n=1 Tax=Tautonia sp. JC769 TaxID=3232135 RepID=UPI00345745DF
MQCPHCHIDLAIADRQGIEIDYCPRCRGVWLDRGELDKLIDRSIAAIGGGTAAARPIDRDDDDRRSRLSYPSDRPKEYARDDDEYTKRRRKKSFLGELFDFD